MTGTSACFLILCFFFLFVHPSSAQVKDVDDYDVPWTIVGDSTDRKDKDKKFVVTGKVTNIETGELLTGASLSVDFFKHYDYTDQNGTYFLELPPGNYRVKIKHIGMLPVFLRIKVFSCLLRDPTCEFVSQTSFK